MTPDDNVSTKCNILELQEYLKVRREKEIHMKTFGISSCPLVPFAVVFAALIHDLDHSGIPNDRLVKEDAEIARTFHYKSVAEQHSVVMAWNLLSEPRFEQLRAAIFGDESGKRRFRQLIVNSVLATDIMDRDLSQQRTSKWQAEFGPHYVITNEVSQEDLNRRATMVVEHIVQASDVAHTMQHWRIFIKWNKRLYNERFDAYEDGRADCDPTKEWYCSQLRFFDNYVIPLATRLRDCGVFGVTGDEYLNYAVSNRSEWERKGMEETRRIARTRTTMSKVNVC